MKVLVVGGGVIGLSIARVMPWWPSAPQVKMCQLKK